jgi:NAD(P)-dependent dehydrogenase (short-subunit alcohol dehydrogenase family)
VGRLDGKIAVITGGASGIGAGTVRRFVDEGARCIVADIQVEAGQALADELGDAAVFRRTDVTVEDDVRSAVELAVDRFGRIDCMINNAGIIGATGSITDISIEAWNDTVAVLLTSVFLGMKHAGAAMVRQGGGGAIVSLASTAGVVGGLGPHVYTAAKHGVVGLTKSVANELAPHGIRVNAIAPGNTVTAMTASAIAGDHTDLEQTAAVIGAGSPLGYPGMPLDIANAALFLACDESRYVSGHLLVVDAGQTTAGMKPSPMHRRSQMIRENGRR